MSFVFFRGHPTSAYTIPFAIDEVSLVPVNKIPADMAMEIGETITPDMATKSAENLIMLDPAYSMAPWNPVKESQYEVNGIMLNLDNTVHRIDYANSEPAKCIGVADTDNPIRTESDIASYEIPVSAYGDMFVVAEISPNPVSKMTVQVDYADVVITPAK